MAVFLICFYMYIRFKLNFIKQSNTQIEKKYKLKCKKLTRLYEACSCADYFVLVTSRETL